MSLMWAANNNTITTTITTTTTTKTSCCGHTWVLQGIRDLWKILDDWWLELRSWSIAFFLLLFATSSPARPEFKRLPKKNVFHVKSKQQEKMGEGKQLPAVRRACVAVPACKAKTLQTLCCAYACKAGCAVRAITKFILYQYHSVWCLPSSPTAAPAHRKKHRPRAFKLPEKSENTFQPQS